ncbi:beta-ketoacyl-[acyl-carrier-protein] synthase family protein [Actinocorallia sp. A-T 12471]|uniref:beta-ketoacyl-[acyl-carrier-protein] synthase family protein n=1 Tax=Actinocorallia sp. A-T 12471 TaxID=3089813 RepID=UPI0029CE3014|nr:beta-ketoacyl-[acyl-carrier-protein] synthase family protein [Actinocorallia sp. A-T 12471]MDX6741416.1 beta-ketoacyl-[acyl-carrier-protein] synthase family protein [Actinocorallia sp. A-T 12471]
MREAVVTGLGATTPLGGDLPSTWAGLLAGKSGVTLIEDEWAAELPSKIAGRLLVEPTELIPRHEARRLDRVEQMALIASREAWKDAGEPEVDPVRLAVVIGTGIGGAITMLEQYEMILDGKARRVSPNTIPMLMPNGPSAYVSMELGAKGGARTPVSACAAGAEAIAFAADLIRLNKADVVVAGGAEACVHHLTMTAFAQMRALSTRNDSPATASRPFDVTRDGFVMGEGAAVMVLESEEFAKARGARIHGRVAGSGITSSAAHITASDPEGQARAIGIALGDAGLSPLDVDHVHAHATSTPQGDVAEAEAIATALGTHPVVTATKSMTGHLIGASGALGAMSAMLSVRDGIVPGVLNLNEIDPEIKVEIAVGASREMPVRAAVANSFGFGGHNVSLVFTP